MAALAMGALIYLAALIQAARERGALRPKPEAIAVGAVTNFFDTLGIGSFAPTMAWFKFRGLVPDELIPQTMLVGHALPIVAQSIIFLILLGVSLDPILLFGCIAALVLGGVIGSRMVSQAHVWVVQLLVAVGLVLAAVAYLMSNLDLMPLGGESSSLPWPLTLAAIALNLVLGVLLNFGVGSYAPTLIALSLMGMDPRYAFPIMASGAALSLAGSSVGHIRAAKVDLRIAIGIALGGIPAVLLAALIVKSMPVLLIRWAVIVIVLYAAAMMLRASLQSRKCSKAKSSDPAQPGQ